MATFVLSACGKTATVVAPVPTATPRSFELSDAEKPYISLIPRTDGHQITLKVTNIPASISKIEYEFIYTAVDGTNQIEKGASGNLDPKTKTQDDILLGTASCTNGCKYKYDEGVTGGLINLILTNNDGQVAVTEQPWFLQSSSQVKKTGKIVWSEENISEKIDYKLSSFFTVIKNPVAYSIFSTSDLIRDVPSASPTQ